MESDVTKEILYVTFPVHFTEVGNKTFLKNIPKYYVFVLYIGKSSYYHYKIQLKVLLLQKLTCRNFSKFFLFDYGCKPPKVGSITLLLYIRSKLNLSKEVSG